MQWVSNGTLSANQFVGQDLNGLIPFPQLSCSLCCVKSVSPAVSCESSVSVHVNLLLCRMNAEVEVKGETPIGVLNRQLQGGFWLDMEPGLSCDCSNSPKQWQWLCRSDEMLMQLTGTGHCQFGKLSCWTGWAG